MYQITISYGKGWRMLWRTPLKTLRAAKLEATAQLAFRMVDWTRNKRRGAKPTVDIWQIVSHHEEA